MDVSVDITYEVEADLYTVADVKVNYELHLTMVDQKVINALTETKSSMRCYICHATPTQFNNLVEVHCSDPKTYVYGISPLHKLIRCFEMLLHIANRTEIKKWRVSSNEDTDVIKRKKKVIHDRFKEELGIKVDEPKQGAGNTNDGNTARRAFKNEKAFADICGLDEGLIHRYRMILLALFCKLPLDANKFGKYCRETAELQLELYPWYRFPVSVHVLLVHGATILSSSVLPIGMMSEEAQEARNKDNKIYRRMHARKTSRTDTMSDVFHRLMVTGDIVISSKSLRVQQSQPLPPDVQSMLKDPLTKDLIAGEIAERDSDSE
nr:uncharacterized protein LOC129266800 [Lytechinus pictus]